MDSLKKKLFSLSRTQIVIFSAIFLVLCIFLILAIGSVWGSIKQPIFFNHKIHADNELMCLDCHIYYEDHASSGRPTIDICSGCHEEPLGDSREEKKIVEHVQSGEEVEWERLYLVPEDVLFSHRRHVVLGSIECAVCHGNIGLSTKPPAKPLKIKMKKCMNCHEKTEVSNDCISCHR